jgi:hypothetical protein
MVEDMDAGEDQALYDQATAIEQMGAGDTLLPRMNQ